MRFVEVNSRGPPHLSSQAVGFKERLIEADEDNRFIHVLGIWSSDYSNRIYVFAVNPFLTNGCFCRFDAAAQNRKDRDRYQMVPPGHVAFLPGDRLLSTGKGLYRLNRGGWFGSDRVCFLLLYHLAHSGRQKIISFPGRILAEAELIFIGSQNSRPHKLRYEELPACGPSVVGRTWEKALFRVAKFILDIFQKCRYFGKNSPLMERIRIRVRPPEGNSW